MKPDELELLGTYNSMVEVLVLMMSKVEGSDFWGDGGLPSFLPCDETLSSVGPALRSLGLVALKPMWLEAGSVAGVLNRPEGLKMRYDLQFVLMCIYKNKAASLLCDESSTSR